MTLFGVTAFLPIPQGGVWEHVQTQVLGSPAASVSFTGLGGDDFYQLCGDILKDSGATNPVLSIRLNNDSGANYSMARLQTNNATRAATQVGAQTSMATVSTLGANGYTGIVAVISKPAAAVRAQMWASISMDQAGLVLVGEKDFGEWGNTAATINRIDALIASGNFAAGSSFRLDKKNAA